MAVNCKWGSGSAVGFGLGICAEIGAVVRSLKRLVGKRDKLCELASYYQVIGTHDPNNLQGTRQIRI